MRALSRMTFSIPLYHCTPLPIASIGSPSFSMNRPPCRVAVIGAGAAGLVAARELQRQGLSVVVFEQSQQLGGVWCYSPEVEDDPLGLAPGRNPVHGSMYESLRTNLPREIMGYLDFPFLSKEGRDGRRFPGHMEVLLYLQDFAEHFNLLPSIRFGRRVKHVCIHEWKIGGTNIFNGSDPEHINSILETMHEEVGGFNEVSPDNPAGALKIQWTVISEAENKNFGINSTEEEVFDAVVMSIGHFFQPKIATISGVEKWPGKQVHSHNYRVPTDFANQVVVVIGNASSGTDISKEIAKVAKEVHWSGRKWNTYTNLASPIGPLKNITLHTEVESAHEDGSVHFQDGGSVVADIILHCTGYAYSFPFLDTLGVVRHDDNHVGPLYQHVFPPLLAPSLSFIGLPFKVVPFPLMELQAKWIALCLSSKVYLPSRKGMLEDIEKWYAAVEAKGRSKNDTHNLDGNQFDYNDWLANQCGCNPPEHWRQQIYLVNSKRRGTDPDNYRDTWTDHKLHAIAIEELQKLGKSIQYV